MCDEALNYIHSVLIVPAYARNEDRWFGVVFSVL